MVKIPYIKQSVREKIEPYLHALWKECSLSEPGEVNYIITQILERYRRGNYSYAKFNEIIGILECVKQEYYRRVIAEYESKKCEENGDVYHW